MQRKLKHIFNDCADQMTVYSLTEYKKLLEKERQNHEVNGAYMHPDDYKRSKKVIKAIDTILRDYT